MKCSIKRIYHPWDKWEEVNFNMWGGVRDRKKFLNKAILFTADHKKYGRFMMRVVREWKYSCEHNLSNRQSNRQAWVGHAACALAFECPEDIVREAWRHLTEDQQIKANKEADKAIEYWEKLHTGEICLNEDLD